MRKWHQRNDGVWEMKTKNSVERRSNVK